MTNSLWHWSHGPVEIVDLPTNSMVIFNSYVNVYQGVLCYFRWLSPSHSAKKELTGSPQTGVYHGIPVSWRSKNDIFPVDGVYSIYIYIGPTYLSKLTMGHPKKRGVSGPTQLVMSVMFSTSPSIFWDDTAGCSDLSWCIIKRSNTSLLIILTC